MNNSPYTYPFYTSGATTNAYQTLTITGANTFYGPPMKLHSVEVVENGLIPDGPEEWLRRRVKEVCDLSKLSAA